MSDADLPAPEHAATRQNRESTTFTTLLPTYEERLIVIAEGVQFHRQNIRDMEGPQFEIPIPGDPMTLNDLIAWDLVIQKFGDEIILLDDDTLTYTSETQRVNFTLHYIRTREEFHLALQTPGIHLIYQGHARYGRGPCFGDNDSPGNHWGNDGLWRVAFPYLAVDAAEILTHQYLADPVPGTLPMPPRDDCHPEVRARYSSYRRYKLSDLAQSPNDRALLRRCLAASSNDDTFWASGTPSLGPSKMNVLLRAGWQNTAR
jgi:hypothetical protein